MRARVNFDIFVARLRRKVKRRLPEPVIARIEKRKRHNDLLAVARLHDPTTPPWSSPNIWEELVRAYQKIERPVIFEYGTGSSSLWHIENLMKQGGGTYIGVEIDPNWFWSLIGAVVVRVGKQYPAINIMKNAFKVDTEQTPSVNISIVADALQIILKLRSDTDEYVAALDQLCDIVVIDGAHRKLCVRHILENQRVKPGGMLMLMEAGRGSPDWWEGQRTGDYDYSAELTRLMDLGGVILDGNGVDSWPNCKRRSPKPQSYYYPMEACKLVFPLRQ